MKKEDFLYLLLGASYVALKFAENYVTDPLPTDFRYRVHLNVSHDSPELTQFDMYPADDGKILEALKDIEVAELLCRREKVPVWVDISVASVAHGFTVFELRCAGRYTDDRKEFYYEKGGSGPFGIKSPPLPAGFQEGTKFRLGTTIVPWWRSLIILAGHHMGQPSQMIQKLTSNIRGK